MIRFLTAMVVTAGIFCSVALGCCDAAKIDLEEKRSDHFIVYYSGVPEDFVDTVIEYAERYYDDLTRKLGFQRYNYWTWDNRAKIYIYPDQETYLEETKQPAWTAGVADYSKKTIWTYPRESGFFDSLLPHELGHIVFREVVGEKSLPIWLEEGVASYLEQAKRLGAQKLVQEALDRGTFIPLDELGRMNLHSVSDDATVRLIYAESVVAVTFLIEEFGADAFNRFCEKLKAGKRFDAALKDAFWGVSDVEELNRKWEGDLRGKSSRSKVVW